MIYLIHKNKDINEIRLIYYEKPSEGMEYKAIDENELPNEKKGYSRKLFYDKIKDKVYAEYEEISEGKSEVDILKERIEQLEFENAMAVVELTELIISKNR